MLPKSGLVFFITKMHPLPNWRLSWLGWNITEYWRVAKWGFCFGVDRNHLSARWEADHISCLFRPRKLHNGQDFHFPFSLFNFPLPSRYSCYNGATTKLIYWFGFSCNVIFMANLFTLNCFFFSLFSPLFCKTLICLLQIMLFYYNLLPSINRT